MADMTSKGGLCGRCLPARYMVAILGSFAMAITYALKVNLSIAMVGMLNHTALAEMQGHDAVSADQQNECMDKSTNASASNESPIEDGPFIWSETLQGSILSSYFWGYIVVQIPGARIAEMFSAKWVLFASVAVNVVCTLLTPVFAELHYTAMIAMRIIEGLGGGVTFPAMHVLLAHWAPPPERSILSSIVYAGTCLGTVLSILGAGVLAASPVGWQGVFYVMGGVCAPWCVLWALLVEDTPSTQRYISGAERDYIVRSLASESGDVKGSEPKRRPPVPWMQVFTSGAFWAILVAHICSNWGWYMILIELPFYMKQVLHFNIKENAILTAIPFLCMWLFSMVLSKILDHLRAKEVISTTCARKIATAIASVIPAVILLALCFIGCTRWLAVLLMTIAVAAKGGMFCGFLSNHIDIAPNFAGTLMAITNTVATIPGIVVPLFVGHLTHGNQTIGAWSIIFYVTIVLYAIEILVYGLLGSGETQKWNKTVMEQEQQPLNQTSALYRTIDNH